MAKSQMTLGQNHQTPTYSRYYYEILYSTLYRLGTSPSVCMNTQLKGRSCSDPDQGLIINDPPAREVLAAAGGRQRRPAPVALPPPPR